MVDERLKFHSTAWDEIRYALISARKMFQEWFLHLYEHTDTWMQVLKCT